MAGTTKFTLAYCSANQPQAKNLDQILSKAGVSFTHIQCGDKGHFPDLLSQAQAPVLLLISDNFLKSSSCIHEIHGSIQQLIRSEHLLPVIIDGVHEDESGNTEYVHTHFDRVSHVIQYMNYWQDQYLEVRKEKRNAESEEESRIDEQLKVIRSISSDIGELLRFVRNSEHYSYADFSARHFELFFQKYGLLDRHPAFKEQLIREGVQAGAYTAAAAPAEPESPAVQETEQEPENLGDIPGMNLLEEQEDQSSLVDQIYSEDDAEEEEQDEAGLPSENGAGYPMNSSRETNEPEEEESAEELATPATDEDDSFLEDDGGQYDFDPSREEAPGIENVGSDEELHELQDIYKEDLDEDYKEGSFLDTEEEEEEGFDDEESDEEIDELFDEEEEEEEPDSQFGHIAKSAAYLIHTGEVDQGMGLFQTILKNQPENHIVRFQYASALLDYKKDLAKGKKQLEEVLNQKQDYYPAYLRLAELAEGEEDIRTAREWYEKAAERKPSLPEIDYKLGLLLQTHFPEEKEQAAGYFYRALKKDPENVDATYRYALLLSEMEPVKEKKAIKYFKRTLKVNKDHPFANYDLALLYHRAEQWEKAAKYYLRACAINPELRTEQNDQAFGIGPDGELLFRTQTQKAEEKSADEDRLICITGATSGIGRAIAELFARDGYRIIITGRREDRLLDMKKDFENKYNARVKTLTFDVRFLETSREKLDQLEDEWKQIDVLINNAGLARGLAPIHEGDIEHWNTMIDTNIKGLLFMTRLIAPSMVERKSGHIVNISSIAGKEVYPNGNVYCATKHAVDALTRSMRMDLHKHNIRVSQVSPGHVEETEFALVRFDGNERKARIYEDFQPLKASDVAQAVYFIITQAPHVNIQDIVMTSTQQASVTMIDRSGRSD